MMTTRLLLLLFSPVIIGVGGRVSELGGVAVTTSVVGGVGGVVVGVVVAESCGLLVGGESLHRSKATFFALMMTK